MITYSRIEYEVPTYERLVFMAIHPKGKNYYMRMPFGLSHYAEIAQLKSCLFLEFVIYVILWPYIKSH